MVVVARSEDKLRRVVKQCNSLGAASANFVSADLSNEETDYFQKVIDDSVRLLGGLDTLVLNHVAVDKTVEIDGYYKKFDMETVRWMYKINTFSYFALAHAATDALEQS